MKYFIPDWDDRVDPNYDFINDVHSPEHKRDPVRNDKYIWDIFGLNNAPIDGVLISRTVIMENKRKYRWALREGIHKVLHLPESFEIMGDCGAFGYVKQKIPPYDPIETLEYYRMLGFNYGVTVDHLVVPQFVKDKDLRMKITFENGIKSYEKWIKEFKDDFQLIVAVQGWDVEDYIKMYEAYLKRGIMHLGFGGLARSPTTFILNLIDRLIQRIKERRMVPEYLHFFGLARFALFPKFRELEELGVNVGFDSASYLRKAWLSSPTTQMNYLSLSGRGYTAIRVPFVHRLEKKRRNTLNEIKNGESLKELELKCLQMLRMYDRDEVPLESVLKVLSKFNKKIGGKPELMTLYRRTLEDKPWKSCDCPICKSIGIEVVIFRGNNRNRRRGFHNIYVFYTVLKNPKHWSRFLIGDEEKERNILANLKKGMRVLVITGCTKEKLGYDSSVRAPAKQMYQGRLFKTVKRYCEAKGFDYVIISAKYGLLHPDEIIEGYEKTLKTKEDVESIRVKVEEKLRPILRNYDKIVIIAGDLYRQVLKNLWDDRFITIKSKGYADLCNIIRKATLREKSLLDFL